MDQDQQHRQQKSVNVSIHLLLLSYEMTAGDEVMFWAAIMRGAVVSVLQPRSTGTGTARSGPGSGAVSQQRQRAVPCRACILTSDSATYYYVLCT